ncbi:sensor histidine kinase [Stutzerimonas xanthomarina]|uniref:sensor histidine kinase n=1 Tax=Stutzerimonas xanthomarina TaxID=271420 RepID=UPI0029AB7831|nr:ATP-binding protein [Stutzerimonas xanthomarina]MDX2352277.1 ATP-binding protein [Stutzerimonas xanthomarina]
MAHVAVWQRTSTLRGALLLKVVIPLVAIMLGFSFLMLWTVERNSERRLQEEVELVARAVRLPLSDSLEKKHERTSQQVLESVLGVGRVYGAYLYDDQGELVAFAGAIEPDQDQTSIQELTADGKRRGGYQRIRGREVYSYFLPLEQSGGRINGLLQVTRRWNDFERDTRRLRFIAGISAAVLALAAVCIVLLGHWSAIGRHLQQLTQSMARVADGDRKHRAPRSGPQEIAVLGRALNQMLDSIADSEQRMAEQKTREAELEARLRRSQQLAAVGRLAAGVAHELGSPLSVIDGKAQRVLRSETLEDGQRKGLLQIRSQVQRLSEIVRQLLDFGRAAGRPVRRMPAEVLAHSSAAAVADELAVLNVTLQLEAAPEPLFCEVDPPRFEQALTNLLRNAAQASPGGQVLLRWWREEGCLLFQVEDDGPGVAEQHRAALFEPFFTTKPVGQGSGLGLAVAHGVVAECGGRIELVESSLGGAAFRISLALAGEEDGDANG